MSNAFGEAAALRRWLFDAALPLWWDIGADRGGGGFHEAIELDGKPLARPHRARSITRQVFSYCEAGRLGWNGPWREAALHALGYFRDHFISENSVVISVVELDGRVGDPTFDLYNQAFALLAYASGHRAFGETDGWRRLAIELRTTLAQSYAHPGGGFLEDRARRLPQRSNPHMHLFEAALAWIEVDGDPAWGAMADGIAKLIASSIRRRERCASSSVRTGRRRRASKDASPSRATTTNGRSCSIAGRSSPAGKGPTRWRG